MRVSLTSAEMARSWTQGGDAWNNNGMLGASRSISWKAFPSGNTGINAFILSGHGTGGCVYQWTAGGVVNTNLLFEYCPVQGADPNHYWMVGDGSGSSTYFRGDGAYGNGPLLNRYGGIALF